MSKIKLLENLIKRIVMEESWPTQSGTMNANVYHGTAMYSFLKKYYKSGMSKQDLFDATYSIVGEKLSEDELKMDINKFFNDLGKISNSLKLLTDMKLTLESIISDLESGNREVGVKSIASVERLSNDVNVLNNTLKRTKK